MNRGKHEMVFYRIISTPGMATESVEVMRCFVEEFKLLKETPKGYWIVPDWVQCGDTPNEYRKAVTVEWKRWVSKTSRKRFAYPSMEEAIQNFRMRCLHRLSHAKRAFNLANAALELSKENDPINHFGKVIENGMKLL